MTTELAISLISVAAAILAIAISVWAARMAREVGIRELQLSRRAELHSMLLDLEKEMLHDTRLIRIYRSDASAHPSTDPLEVARLEQYVRMHFGLFELLHSEFRVLTRLNKDEREISDGWHRFMADFFRQSEVARRVWKREGDIYYRSFRDDIDRLIARIEVEEASRVKIRSHAR